VICFPITFDFANKSNKDLNSLKHWKGDLLAVLKELQLPVTTLKNNKMPNITHRIGTGKATVN
jgi:hypothetical protein